MAEAHYRVVVIGAGIAGAALAAALGRRGFSVALVEKSADDLDTARGDHLQPRVVEILESWGLAERLVEAGAERRLGSRYFAADGRLLLDAPLDDLPVPHPYYLFLDHDRIGRVFVEAAEDAGVDVYRPVPRWTLEREGERIEAVVCRLHDGGEARLRCDVLVGADGRSSRVRTELGLPTDDHVYESPLATLFAEAPADDPRHEVNAYLGTDRLVVQIPRTGAHWKIGVPVERERLADWRRSRSAERRAWLAELAPALPEVETEFAGFYPARMTNAVRWVAGNAVVVGDAAHTMHPARGQGMNLSLRNLDVLVRCLSEADDGDLRPALARYEAAVRPALEPLLLDNHRRALLMDRPGPGDALSALETLFARLESDPAAHFRYRMQTAGYPEPGA